MQSTSECQGLIWWAWSPVSVVHVLGMCARSRLTCWLVQIEQLTCPNCRTSATELMCSACRILPADAETGAALEAPSAAGKPAEARNSAPAWRPMPIFWFASLVWALSLGSFGVGCYLLFSTGIPISWSVLASNLPLFISILWTLFNGLVLSAAPLYMLGVRRSGMSMASAAFQVRNICTRYSGWCMCDYARALASRVSNVRVCVGVGLFGCRYLLQLLDPVYSYPTQWKVVPR